MQGEDDFSLTRVLGNILVLLLVWTSLVIFDTWLILVPSLFLAGIVLKEFLPIDFCPLCLSFYGTWTLFIIYYVFYDSLVPLWVIAGMVGYSASKGAELVQRRIERNGYDVPLSWPILNYFALALVLYGLWLLTTF